MNSVAQAPTIDFYMYPPVGGDDWRYTFAVAKVRALETLMLSRTTLVDLANASDFSAALDMLSSTEYAPPSSTRDFDQVEQMLLQKRSDVRDLFVSLMLDEPLVQLLKEKDDPGCGKRHLDCADGWRPNLWLESRG